MSLILDAAKANNIKLIGDDEDDNIKSLANTTGFNAVDIFSGNIEFDRKGRPILNGGLLPRTITVVGQSGTGKTTLVLQLGAAIVDRWNRMYPGTAELIFRDVEENTPISRVQSITGWSDNKILSQLSYGRDDMSITDIYNELRKIADLKEKNKAPLRMNTQIYDIDGMEMSSYAPTIYVIDSIAALNSSGIEEWEFDKKGALKEVETVNQNITAAREANANTAFVKKVKRLLSKYNIVLIMINHITSQMITSAYDIPPRYLSFLKPGEKVKGGAEMIYQSFAILRTTHGTHINDKDPIYGDDVRGLINKFAFIKNKSNVEGITVPMVFDQKMGYLPDLSDWEYIYASGYGFGGSPASYYLSILPEVKFTRKTLFQTSRTNGVFARALSFTTRLKMMADIMGPTFRSMTAFDLSNLSYLPYEQRVSLIYFHTEEYPFFRNKNWYMSLEEAQIAYTNIHKLVQNPDASVESRNNPLITGDQLDNLVPTEEGTSYMIDFSEGVSPFSEKRETGEDGTVYIFPDEE